MCYNNSVGALTCLKFNFEELDAMKIKIFPIILSVCLLFTSVLLASCDLDKDSAADGNTTQDKYSNQINISVLNGTTGFGIAKLMEDVSSGSSAFENAKFSVESDPSNILSGLINGSIDIAALPTNAAANVYNKTGGKVKIAAVNTLGVLYVVVNSENVVLPRTGGIEALRGKTVYCPAQNPAFIMKALCEKSGLKVGEDIIIDTAYSQPADLRAAIVSGKVDIAVLPEPMVTIATSANDKLCTAIDLTHEWNKVFTNDSLMQGCIVVRTDWLEQNAVAFEQFMKEYKASVEYVNTNVDDAAKLIVKHNIFTNESVAKKAIPNCNIKFVDGDEMAQGLNKFFEALYSVAPASIGNNIPANDIYYKK